MLKPVLGSQIQLGHPLANGLVGCWLMNEGSGNKVYDLSGNGNTGSLIADTHFVGGKFGPALDFDGAGDCVNCGNKASLNITNKNFTIMAWAKLYGEGNTLPVLAGKLSYGSVGEWGLYYSDITNDFRFQMRDASGVVVVDTLSVSLNQWYYVVGVYNGSSIGIYLDGLLIKSINAPTIFEDSGNNFFIGKRSNNNDYYWNGQIDHAMIYNRALSAQEIQQLYMSPFCMFGQEPIELWSAAMGGVPAPSNIIYDYSVAIGGSA